MHGLVLRLLTVRVIARGRILEQRHSGGPHVTVGFSCGPAAIADSLRTRSSPVEMWKTCSSFVTSI